jgi:hypothetical protein
MKPESHAAYGPREDEVDEQQLPIEQKEYHKHEEATGQEDQFRQKSKIWLICAAAGLAAVGWRWGYAEHPDFRGLFLSIGVTLLSAAGALLIWRRLMRNDRHSPETEGHSALPMMNEPESLRNDRQDAGSRENMKFDASLDTGDKRNVPMDTMMGAEGNGRTQLLTEEKKETPSRQANCLLWETGPGTPLIPLTVDSFLIGRSREACAHVDETKGVSRVHLELLRTEEGWTAKDLGSRNGTKLNGVPMVAYAVYPLQAEDCLELAGSRYRLK